ncbi:hypothetical protein [Spirosoma sp.]|uniref:hypothetical protein n=1 Tax=Spirosoma sp. TaxID=1899569 RepID=UPI003B3BC65B
MRLLLAFCLSLLFGLTSRAQERVRNVRIQTIDSSQIQIWYDLVEARPGDSIYVQMESRVRGPIRMLPEFVRGDIGKRVLAGSNRRIVWDALANGYPLNEEIRATVLVMASLQATANQPISTTGGQGTDVTSTNAATRSKDAETPVAANPRSGQRNEATSMDEVRSRRTRYAGPAWALLSAVAPGVGNIFVQTPRPKVGFRLLLTTGFYSLLTYGLTERQKSLDQYALYEQQKNRAAGEPYYQAANNHHHTYFLTTRGAVVIAAADVVFTFIRGLRNGRLQRDSQRSQAVTVWPGIQAGQPTAVVRYSF